MAKMCANFMKIVMKELVSVFFSLVKETVDSLDEALAFVAEITFLSLTKSSHFNPGNDLVRLLSNSCLSL